MKTFKQFLNEAPIDTWDVSWKRKYLDHIMEQDTYFYLPPATIKQILGVVPVTSFHGTTIDGLRKLKSIQHTRKSVSSFNKMYNPIGILTRILSGDYKENTSHYDVLVKLQGELVFSSDDDIYSMPDEKGIRGLGTSLDLVRDYERVKSRMLSKLFYDFGEKYRDVIIDYLPPKLKYADFIGDSYEIYFELNHIKRSINTPSNIKRLITAFFRKIMFEFYKFCIDIIEDNKDYVLSNFFNATHKRVYGAYNEIIIDKFSIEEIIIICANKNRVETVMNGLKKLGLINKVVNYQHFIEDVDDFEEYAPSREQLLNEPAYNQLVSDLKQFIDDDGTNTSNIF